MLWESFTCTTKKVCDKKREKRPTKRAKKDAPKKGKRSTDDEEVENPVQDELLKKIEALGKRLPTNTLDQLIDELGGPEIVAEVCT